MIVFGVRVSSRRIRLPNLDQAVRYGVTIAVQHSPAHNDALASRRCACMLKRQVAIFGPRTLEWPKTGPVTSERVCGRKISGWDGEAQSSWRGTRDIQIIRLPCTLLMASEGNNRLLWIVTLALNL